MPALIASGSDGQTAATRARSASALAITVMLSRADGEGEVISPQGNPRFKDVATPFGGELCNCHAAGKDGILDLRAKFKTAAMEAAFGFDAEPTGTVIELSLTGTLLDGAPFQANDCIRIDR